MQTTVTCPHCGNEIGDLWELGFLTGDEDDTVETTCGSCGGDVSITRDVTVEYSIEAGHGNR